MPSDTDHLGSAARAKLIEPERLAELLGRGRANVIVMLSLQPDVAAAGHTAAGMATLKAAVRELQDLVLADALPALQSVMSEHSAPQRIGRFSGLPGFAASLTMAEIEALTAHPLVVSITENTESRRMASDDGA